MKRSKRLVVTLLLTMLIVQLFAPHNKVWADSAYDDAYKTTSSLQVGDEGMYYVKPFEDLSYTWANYITDASTWSGSASWHQAAKNSFEQAQTSGSWGVSQVIRKDSQGKIQKEIMVFWNESSSLAVNFDTAYTTVVAEHSMSINYTDEGGYEANKIYSYNPGFINETPANLEIASAREPSSLYTMRNYFLANGDIDYPDDYEGILIRTEAPTPVTSPYVGTVDCGGEEPLSVGIYQAGNNGSATLIPLSLGRAEWSYDLSSAPYSIQVLCGGELGVSSGAVYPSIGTDWVCDIYGDSPHFCVLS